METKTHEKSLAALAAGRQTAERFGAGNDASLKHGYWSTGERFEPRAGEIREELEAILPVKSESDGPAVALLALTLARVESMESWVAKNGWHDKKGTPRRVLSHLSTERRAAVGLMAELGLTPRSRSQLGVNLLSAGEAYRRHVREAYGEKS